MASEHGTLNFSNRSITVVMDLETDVITCMTEERLIGHHFSGELPDPDDVVIIRGEPLAPLPELAPEQLDSETVDGEVEA